MQELFDRLEDWKDRRGEWWNWAMAAVILFCLCVNAAAGYWAASYSTGK